ncbi:hypothetical protein JW935_28225 [candidate division KSB1 bacterium]|nr:hypothetical protein [candidate division KSB1 bacterium]
MKTIHRLTSLSAVFLLILVHCVNLSWADEEKTEPIDSDFLGIQFTCGLASYREDLVVPLGFHGLGLSLGALYSRQYGENALNARYRFGLGYMQNRYDHEALVVAQEIRLSWYKKVFVSQKYGEFWSGICLPLQMNNLFWGSWDDAHLYWLTAYGIGAAFQWQKEIPSNRHVLIRMEIPVINWVSRPPRSRYTKQEPMHHLSYHFTEPNKSLHFETLDTYQALFFQILLKKELSRSFMNLGIEFQYNHFLNAKSLLVVKNGKLVFEAYCRSTEDRDRLGHLASVTKSITSLTIGIVKSEGYIDSLDQRLYDMMPEKFPPEIRKRSITL